MNVVEASEISESRLTLLLFGITYITFEVSLLAHIIKPFISWKF
jgi:hypothetical protein